MCFLFFNIVGVFFVLNVFFMGFYSMLLFFLMCCSRFFFNEFYMVV